MGDQPISSCSIHFHSKEEMNQIQNQESNDQTTKEIEKLEEANKEEEQRIRNLENKTLQNVNLYFIFQSIILASTTATTASCHNWWIPFTLSLFAAITNFSNFCSVAIKVLSLRERLDQNESDLGVMKLHNVTKSQIEQVLPASPLNHQGCQVLRSKVGLVKRCKRRLVVYSSIGLFVGFTVVLIYGCYRMLCHPGHTKCVKVC